MRIVSSEVTFKATCETRRDFSLLREGTSLTAGSVVLFSDTAKYRMIGMQRLVPCSCDAGGCLDIVLSCSGPTTRALTGRCSEIFEKKYMNGEREHRNLGKSMPRYAARGNRANRKRDIT